MKEGNAVTLFEFLIGTCFVLLFGWFVIAFYDQSEACGRAKCPEGTTPAMVRGVIKYSYQCACVVSP